MQVSAVMAHALSMWLVESSWSRNQIPVPALAGGFPTTGPPGKSDRVSLKCVVTEKNPSVSGPAVQTHVVQGSTGYIHLIYVYVYSLLLRIHFPSLF